MTSLWQDRHPGTKHFEPLFSYGHLPEGSIRQASALCADLADTMVSVSKDGPELSAGLRKLLEAKDCFVRSAVLARDSDA